MEKVRKRLKSADDGDRQMVTILGCVPADGFTAVEAACQEALDHGVCSASVIINILAPNRDMGENWLSSRVFKSYDDVVDHCCDAWQKLESQPWRIMSIGRRERGE